MLVGIVIGFLVWFTIRFVLGGFFTVQQNERVVKTSFGRAIRLGNQLVVDGPLGEALRPDEKERYPYPNVKVIGPGGPYFKWPWERVYKASIATQTVNMAQDLENPDANNRGEILEAVTKDQLNTGLQGQIRYRVSEQNLYAYFFGVKRPLVHVMGYFVSILRERIANFEAPKVPIVVEEGALALNVTALSVVAGVSINDLRKNQRDLNEHMDRESRSSAARYGIELDASLITAIDPPQEVESALAAINTAHNQVSADISQASASSDQKLVQSRRAVEIETLNAQAEVEPLKALAEQLAILKASGPDALSAYLRNVRLRLFNKAQRAIVEVK
jgi:regulator of protease activity HflC (stomatin/prohibitin superfamily)